MGRIEYSELASANIKEKRDAVISSCSKGGFTLAQRMVVEEGKKKTFVYLKNAIQIENIEGLYNLRDALNVAIDLVEQNKEK